MFRFFILVFSIAALSGVANARSASHSTGHAAHGTAKAPKAPHVANTHSKAVAGVGRDSHGKIERSTAAKDAFKKQQPCPATGKSSGACPGYVIDHVKPLACGGADAPGNMQWQTVAEGKVKDKVERKGC